ncbi:hypothetical protein NLN92_24295 [Citrobacter portucalensis]|nr:hypothetical protein [Citrobacter portucalensis]
MAALPAITSGRGVIWSPQLVPLITLGVEANSDAERQHCADLLARKWNF